MDFAFKKKSLKAYTKLMFNSYIGTYVTILRENFKSRIWILGTDFLTLFKKSSLIGIQLSHKEVIGIIFMETALEYKPHFRVSRSKLDLSMKIVKKIILLIVSYFQR